MENPKTGILTFEQIHGKKNIGGSRIRGYWLNKYWPESEIFVQGRKYDSVIFQKVYWSEYAKAFPGIKILDICDPDFLSWACKFIEMANECDAITTSTQALADQVKNFLPDKKIQFIRDRMDLEYHSVIKDHKGKGRAKTAVWFGYSSNFDMLGAVLTFLVRFNLDLIVISDKAFLPPGDYVNKIDVINHTWKVDTVNQHIVEGDIVLNPQSTKGRWKFKSENKTITAHLLGMPVAQTVEELEFYLEEQNRVDASEKNLISARENYDVRISVKEYQDLINEIKATKGIAK